MPQVSQIQTTRAGQPRLIESVCYARVSLGTSPSGSGDDPASAALLGLLSGGFLNGHDDRLGSGSTSTPAGQLPGRERARQAGLETLDKSLEIFGMEWRSLPPGW